MRGLDHFEQLQLLARTQMDTVRVDKLNRFQLPQPRTEGLLCNFALDSSLMPLHCTQNGEIPAGPERGFTICLWRFCEHNGSLLFWVLDIFGGILCKFATSPNISDDARKPQELSVTVVDLK